MQLHEIITKVCENKVNALPFNIMGKVLAVNIEKMAVKIQLNTRNRNGDPIIFENIPVIYPRFGNCFIAALPNIGDMVCISVTKYNLDLQRNDLLTEETNLRLGNIFGPSNMFVWASFPKEDDEHISTLEEQTMVIKHNSGSYIKFNADGSIEIKATRVDINELDEVIS